MGRKTDLALLLHRQQRPAHRVSRHQALIGLASLLQGQDSRDINLDLRPRHQFERLRGCLDERSGLAQIPLQRICQA